MLRALRYHWSTRTGAAYSPAAVTTAAQQKVHQARKIPTSPEITLRMIEDGAMRGIDAVFGLHVGSGSEVGQVSTRAGDFMVTGDEVEIVVRGQVGHAARPHVANNPLVLSAHLLLAVQNIVKFIIIPSKASQRCR